MLTWQNKEKEKNISDNLPLIKEETLESMFFPLKFSTGTKTT